MKSKFSKLWNKSKQPRKQRKFIANAPLHIKGKLISSHLSKDLRTQYGFRSIRLKVGDKVKIMRGQHKGKEDTVIEINIKKQKVYLTKIQITRIDGNTAKVPFKASNLLIVDLNLNDKKRKIKLESKKKPKVSVKKEEAKTA